MTAFCVFAGSFVRPIGGYLADRFGGVRILVGIYACVGILAFAVAQLPAVTMATSLLFVLMATLGCGNGAVFQLVPQRFPRQIGVMTGIVGAAGGLGGFFLPTLLGYVKQNLGSFGAGFGIFGIAAAIAIGLILVLHPIWQRAGWLGAGGKAVTA